MKPLISVIIPTYNNENDLKICINSILAQTYTNHEIIVIDDGSTDNTSEICKGYGDKIKYIKIQHTSSPSIARNVGIKASKGDIIAYQDADDISYGNRFELEIAEINKGADMVYSGESFYGMLSPSNKYHNSYFFQEYNYKKLLKCNYIPCGSVMHKRSILLDVGMWNENLDWDLWIRIGEKYNIVGINKALYHYNDNLNGISKKRGILKHKNLEIQMYKDTYERTKNLYALKLLRVTQIEYWFFYIFRIPKLSQAFELLLQRVV